MRATNIKAFAETKQVEFGPITLLVGKNNSGKSTILRCLYAAQEMGQLTSKDVRLGQVAAEIELEYEQIDGNQVWGSLPAGDRGRLKIQVKRNGSMSTTFTGNDGIDRSVGPISHVFPGNLYFRSLVAERVGLWTKLSPVIRLCL